jgi:hypothetical protein
MNQDILVTVRSGSRLSKTDMALVVVPSTNEHPFIFETTNILEIWTPENIFVELLNITVPGTTSFDASVFNQIVIEDKVKSFGKSEKNNAVIG